MRVRCHRVLLTVVKTTRTWLPAGVKIQYQQHTLHTTTQQHNEQHNKTLFGPFLTEQNPQASRACILHTVVLWIKNMIPVCYCLLWCSVSASVLQPSFCNTCGNDFRGCPAGFFCPTNAMTHSRSSLLAASSSSETVLGFVLIQSASTPPALIKALNVDSSPTSTRPTECKTYRHHHRVTMSRWR